MSARKTALDRVEAYVEHRTGMLGIHPDEVNTVWRSDEKFTLTLSDLRELVAQAKELAAIKSRSLIMWSGDWGALVDADGNLLDQGHWDDLRERTLEAIGIEADYPSGPFPFDRRVPEGTNLKEHM